MGYPFTYCATCSIRLELQEIALNSPSSLKGFGKVGIDSWQCIFKLMAIVKVVSMNSILAEFPHISIHNPFGRLIVIFDWAGGKRVRVVG